MTDNPGVWPLHCHIGWHLAVGKMAVIVVQPDALALQAIPDAATAVRYSFLSLRSISTECDAMKFIQLCDASNIPSGDTVNTIAAGRKKRSTSSVRSTSLGEMRRMVKQIGKGRRSQGHAAKRVTGVIGHAGGR